MTYSETIEYLYGLEATRGWDLKLERVRSALEVLGRPEASYPSLLIAGTNGKGTTAALVHGALTAAGHRAGLYTSPHLVHFTERIRIGHDEIDPQRVVSGVESLRRRVDPERTGLTFFEMATLLALEAFAEARVDVAVLEVGLGGRLDATNVVEPVCSAITSIGLDHQQYLGDTVAEIAREKAGVLRAGRPTVLGPRLPPEAARAIVARAAETGAELVCAAPDGAPGVGIPGASTRADAAVAVRLLDELERARPGLRVPAAARVRAFRDVRWPGRLEVLPGRPKVILDGAHNPESTRSLCDELPALAGGPVRLVFGALGDKPWGELAAMLRPHVAEVVAVRLRQGPQHRPGAEPRELAAAFAPVPARIGEDPFGETARLAREDPDTPILVTGSLFLVGDFYAEWLAQSGRRSVFDPVVEGMV